jgi:hypothetical protein
VPVLLDEVEAAVSVRDDEREVGLVHEAEDALGAYQVSISARVRG